MDEDLPEPRSHRRAWVAAVAAFLAHNVEEVTFDLPAWSTARSVLPWLGWMGPHGVFSTAVGLVSFAVGGLALYAIATGPRWSRMALQILAVVMLANAVSHIALSVITGTLMPGAATAAVLVTPVMTGILVAVRRVRA